MHARSVRAVTVLTLLAFLAYPLSPALAATDATLSGQVVARDMQRIPFEGVRTRLQKAIREKMG